MTTTELHQITENKTRVLLFGINPTISKLILFTINYLQKDIDYAVENESSINGNELFLYESTDLNITNDLPPTVAFIGSDVLAQDYTNILTKITGGGILVYPEFNADLDKNVLQTTNFFRKIPFNKPELEKSGEKLALKTDMGNIPLSFKDENILQDILGAQHLCQHIGIMEDEFYEALIAF